MVKFFLNLWHRLDQHSGTILLAGIAASLVVNALAYRRDLKALRRLREVQPRPALPPSPPLVSFLVPAWNETEYVADCVRSILALQYPHKELVLCAGGSDETLAICRHFIGDNIIVLEQQPGEGKQGALRRCFENSHGAILFFTDADSILDDYSVQATLAPLIFENEHAVTGFWQPFERHQAHPFAAYQWANHLRYQAMMPYWADTLDGRNSAVRREALLAAGGFLRQAEIGTDYVLSQQLKAKGYRIRSVLASRVRTAYALKSTDYLQQGSRWYRNRLVQGARFHQWRDVLSSLWAAGASLFILTGPLAVLLGWRPVAFAWMAGLFHLSLSQARLADFFRKSGFASKSFFQNLVEFIGFTLVSDAAMVKGLFTSFNRHERKTW